MSRNRRWTHRLGGWSSVPGLGRHSRVGCEREDGTGTARAAASKRRAVRAPLVCARWCAPTWCRPCAAPGRRDGLTGRHALVTARPLGHGRLGPAKRSEGDHGPHDHRSLTTMADRPGPRRARRSERPPPARQEREVWIYGSAVFGVVAPDETEAKRSARQTFLPGYREIDLPRVWCEARVDGRVHDLP